MNSFLLLGTGASLGVPLIGCSCEVCRSDSPYNKRTRSGALIKQGDKRIQIDVSSDFREQALRFGINRLDGVIFTHSHQDHTSGIDDLRAFSFKQKETIECLASHATGVDLMKRYHFMFENQPSEGHSRLKMVELRGERGQTEFHGVKLGYMTFKQIGMKVNGFRFGNLAYLTDIKTYPETIFEDLEGIEILVISALRFTSSHMHFDVDGAIDFADKAGAKITYLTHHSHELEYSKTNCYLPERVRMGYDGLEIPFTPYD
jgi:phosphoribosyl 1,2-cyclic phosphate phosphodiesterase